MNPSRAVAVWLLIVAAESVSGTIRQLWIVPALGERPAHRIGVLMGVALIALISWLTARWLGARTTSAQLRIGALWVVLTMVFEFGLGRVLGIAPRQLLADYDLSHGGLMGLGLTFMFFAPLLAARLRGPENQPMGSR
jgi:hypothetical protein